jgi:hypothetical protein
MTQDDMLLKILFLLLTAIIWLLVIVPMIYDLGQYKSRDKKQIWEHRS